MKFQGCIIDFEAIINEDKKDNFQDAFVHRKFGHLTHSISIIPFTIDFKQKLTSVKESKSYSLRNGMTTPPAKNYLKNINIFTLHEERGISIHVKDTTKTIIHHCKKFGKDGTIKHLNDKFIRENQNCHEKGITVYNKSFYEAVELMVKFINTHGNLVISHCFENDMQNLYNTQYELSGKRPFKRNFPSFLDTGCNIKGWSDIRKICSRSLINRTPNFINEYQLFSRNNILITEKNNLKTNLISLTKFVKDDIHYKQDHTATSDICDLFEVVKKMIKTDGLKIFDGKDYLQTFRNIQSID